MPNFVSVVRKAAGRGREGQAGLPFANESGQNREVRLDVKLTRSLIDTLVVVEWADRESKVSHDPG